MRELEMDGRLVLEDGSVFPGKAFGWRGAGAGEVVFNTGMIGYPECLTDPSYSGQVLVLTYPLVGNYGVPPDKGMPFNLSFESERVHISGLVVMEACAEASHWSSSASLGDWLQAQRVPGLAGVDTRALTQKLRTSGSMLGKLEYGEGRADFRDPNRENLVANVSVAGPVDYGRGAKRVVVVDCGCKNNIIRSLVSRGVAVTVVPWHWPVEEREVSRGRPIQRPRRP